MVNSSLVEYFKLSMNPHHYPVAHVPVQCKLMTTNFFFQVAKNAKIALGCREDVQMYPAKSPKHCVHRVHNMGASIIMVKDNAF